MERLRRVMRDHGIVAWRRAEGNFNRYMHAVDMTQPIPRTPRWKRARWALAGTIMAVGSWVQDRSGITWRDGAGAYIGWRGRVAHLGGRIWRAGERLI